MMYGGGWKGLIFVLISGHALFCLSTATTCTSQITVNSYRTSSFPIAYNNSPTTDPLCQADGNALSCSGGASLLVDSDTGSSELNASKAFAWDREVNIAFVIPQTKVKQVNLFFYNIPSSGIGLPPAELFWSNTTPLNPDTPLSHAIVGNQDLSQDDRTLRNVSLVVTTDQDTDYKYFRIRFTFPTATSLIDWILLSEVKLCGEAVAIPTTNITFLQPPSTEPPPGPDNVVSAANLSCTVANEGSFHWQWTSPSGITLSQMWVADGTRTSIVQVSQISAANAGDYTCRASFNGQSASTSIAVQLNHGEEQTLGTGGTSMTGVNGVTTMMSGGPTGSTTTPSGQLNSGVIAAAVIIALIFISALVIGVIVLVVVFLRWHKKMATKSDLRTQNGNDTTKLTAMAATTVSGLSPRKHTADDIEWQIVPQLYSAVHKKTPPAIPAQNFDTTELEHALYDDTVPKQSKQMTGDDQTEQENKTNQLDIYADPLQGRRLTPNATFRSEPIYSEALDPTLLFSQDMRVSGKGDLHPYGAIYADPQPLKRSEAPIEITASNIHELKQLGFGQFGEVLLAETVGVSLKDMKLSQDDDSKNIHIQVAVKKLKPKAQVSVREAFEKEIKFMSRLKDENIVCLLAICTSDSPFIVMEYMENGDLNQYLQEYKLATSDSPVILPNQLPTSILVYMVVQIASGMRYLASLKYVHRDMATRNCLVGKDYTVKIVDFGMSRSLYEDSYYRVRGKAMLPIRWMATESFYGRFSEKTDVWAYGVTMWEVFCLCKEQPYKELNDQEVIQNAIRGTGRQLLPKPEGCSQDIYEMMLRCWEYGPDERADFEEIFSTLSAIHIHM